MNTHHDDLGKPIDVDLSSIHLDPNNPRISPEPAPGYEDAHALFDPELQGDLARRVYEVYKASTLEESLVEQGWTPVDPIIVWEHPSGLGHVVVEGNTRISVLKRVRERLGKEQAKLKKMAKGAYPKAEVREQQRLVEKIEALIEQTDVISVTPVIAADAVELHAKLPRLLGVRHIRPAKPWTPYAQNLYIITLYDDIFAELYPGKELRLEDDALDRIARQLPLKRDEIRKKIQAASAFGHFKRNFEDRLAEVGNKFGDGDQYFLDNILGSKIARDEFGFGPRDLRLSDEAEEALFAWAFSKPRAGDGGDEEAINENVFQKAEDIRIWQRVARYDAKTGVTNFARRLSLANPGDAVPVWQLEREQQTHRADNTPVRAFEELLKALKDLKADTLKAQALLLRPMLVEIGEQVEGYLQMVKAASGGEDDDD